MTDGAEAAARLRAGETLTAAELPAAWFDQDRFVVGALGLEWDTFALHRVTAHLECDERHQQPYGIVHGGVWCSVVETVASFGAALNATLDGDAAVGVSNATDFLRAHRRGRIDAVAEPLHLGRSQQLWQTVLTRSSDGKAVARGQVRLQRLPQREDLAGRALRLVPPGEHGE